MQFARVTKLFSGSTLGTSGGYVFKKINTTTVVWSVRNKDNMLTPHKVARSDKEQDMQRFAHTKSMCCVPSCMVALLQLLCMSACGWKAIMAGPHVAGTSRDIALLATNTACT
eukprot:1139591-Pelagomonas_calceolata.AAC.1